MEQLISVTRTALAQQESSSRDIHKRNLISDAQRLLATHEPALRKAYPAALLEIFAEGPSAPKAHAGRDAGLDFGELALMDDDAVLAQVELSRAQQIAVHATEASLAELNTLVSSAQGLHNVQPEGNPLRPENYIRALQQVVGETGVGSDVRQLWMGQMRELFGTQLVGVYQRAAQSLREHGVEPVGYAVAGAMGGAPRSAYGGGYATGMGYSASAYGAPGSGYGPAQGQGAGWGGGASAPMPLAPAAEEALLTVGMLRQMLAGGGDPFAFDAAQAGAGYVPVGGVPAGQVWVEPQHAGGGYMPAAAAEAMEDMAQLERIVGRLSGGQAAVPATGWGHTTSQGAMGGPARSAHDVVSRMMDNIAQDSRLLPPMQRAVQSLEPALKQLVSHDTRFFSDEQHPARRLLDELTQRSLAFNHEDLPGFSRFMRLVNEAVGHLAKVEVKDAAPFDTVLRALEKAWQTQEQKLRERREAQQRELLQREQRELLAEKMAADFRKLPDAGKVPPDLLAFVTGPWADVVALAQSQANQASQASPGAQDGDPGGYLALVPLLLCCGQPELLRADPERLAGALAQMAPTVRRGLHSIAHPPERTEEVLARLAALEHEALQYAAAGPQAAQGEDWGVLADETLQPGAGPESGAAPAAPEAAGAAGAAAQAPAEAPLRIGQWVEITTHQRPVRTQLTWCSPHNTLFLFTAADGSTQSMTRRVMDKLAAEGQFQLISAQPVVDRALSAVRAKPRKA